MVSVVFINLELGIKNEGEKKLSVLQNVFEAIYMSVVKFEGEARMHTHTHTHTHTRARTHTHTHTHTHTRAHTHTHTHTHTHLICKNWYVFFYREFK